MSSSYDSALVDTAMIEDPHLLALPRGVRLLHLEALVWCKARLTDGFVPSGALRRMTDELNPDEAAEMLVEAGVWEDTEGGWRLVGFLDTQMSARRVREKRENARKRYDEWQRTQRVRQRVTNGAANASARPAPPARKGWGQVGGEPGEPSAPGAATGEVNGRAVDEVAAELRREHADRYAHETLEGHLRVVTR